MEKVRDTGSAMGLAKPAYANKLMQEVKYNGNNSPLKLKGMVKNRHRPLKLLKCLYLR